MDTGNSNNAVTDLSTKLSKCNLKHDRIKLLQDIQKLNREINDINVLGNSLHMVCSTVRFPSLNYKETISSQTGTNQKFNWTEILLTVEIVYELHNHHKRKSLENYDKKLLAKFPDIIIYFVCLEYCLKNYSEFIIKEKQQLHFVNKWKSEYNYCIAIFEDDCLTAAFAQKLLERIHQKLKSATWKSFLRGYVTYNFVMNNIKNEEISSLFPNLFPFALVLTDDFNPYYTVQGISCLLKLQNEIPPQDLRMQGVQNVLFDAIKKKLYANNYQVIKAALPCLLTSLRSVENDPKSTNFKRDLSKYNEVCDIVTSSLQMTSDTKIKRIQAEFLVSLVDTMGITIVWHIQDLMSTFEIVLELCDSVTVDHVLNCIMKLFSVAWIRMKSYCERLIKILLKLLYDLEHNQNQVSNNSSMNKVLSNIDHTIECLRQIFIIKPELKKKTLRMMKTSKILAFTKHCSVLE